jgi:hypothetical protein
MRSPGPRRGHGERDARKPTRPPRGGGASYGSALSGCSFLPVTRRPCAGLCACIKPMTASRAAGTRGRGPAQWARPPRTTLVMNVSRHTPLRATCRASRQDRLGGGGHRPLAHARGGRTDRLRGPRSPAPSRCVRERAHSYAAPVHAGPRLCPHCGAPASLRRPCPACGRLPAKTSVADEPEGRRRGSEGARRVRRSLHPKPQV